jgi:predicted dehydrogenase
MTIRLGVLGLGSVFSGPYASLIQRLALEGRVELTAAYDVDAEKRKETADRFGTDPSTPGPEAVIDNDDVDAVLVLTSMNEHGPLARAGLAAGKHVLVEKPMATSLSEAAELVDAAKTADGKLVCAPHIVLSKTFREMHRRVQAGEVGPLLLARARYGWAGPWWGDWYYRPGGGALFDLGIYNLTALCGFFGSVQRVTALVGTAIPERMVQGKPMKVEVDDNAHVLLDFGQARFASVTTGFTIQRYRSPAIELYGAEGVLQMLGDDWTPEGFEQWSNTRGSWEVVPESDPQWPWTDGLRHLVDAVDRGLPTVTRPEHAYHALEVMLAAKQSAETGRVVAIESEFPALDYGGWDFSADDARRKHDPRSS